MNFCIHIMLKEITIRKIFVILKAGTDYTGFFNPIK